MWRPSRKGSIPAPEKEFWQFSGGFEQAFSVPKKEQEKDIGAFPRQRLFTAARSASCRKGLRVLKIDAFLRFPELFDAKFEKSRRKAPCHKGLRRRFDMKLIRFALL